MGETDKAPVATANSDFRPVYISMGGATEENGVDIVDLWRSVLDGKWLILGVAAVFAVLAIAYSLMATPIYRAESVLSPARDGAAGRAASGLSGLASLAGIDIGMNDDTVQESIAILKSRKFAEEFIRENNLLPVLFAEQWDPETESWMTDSPEEIPDIRDAVNLFVDSVMDVTEDPQTGLVTLGVEWSDAQLVATWAAELVARVNEAIRRRDISESEQKLNYLYGELGKANLVELREAISRVIEEQINAMMLAQGKIEYAFKVIDPPVIPKKRARPQRTLIVVVATLLGGFIGVFVVLARSTFRRR